MKKKNLKQKFIEIVQDESMLAALEKLISWSFNRLKLNLGIIGPFEKRKKFLSNKLVEKFNGVIQYGPFKGLKFVPESA